MFENPIRVSGGYPNSIEKVYDNFLWTIYFSWCSTAIFLMYLWKKEITRKEKWDKTLMIIFLGVFGKILYLARRK